MIEFMFIVTLSYLAIAFLVAIALFGYAQTNGEDADLKGLARTSLVWGFVVIKKTYLKFRDNA